MCGIVGLLDISRARTRDVLDDAVRAMSQQLRHRGPDDEGRWIDPEFGVALGHTRLSILDLSPSGHQPMVSPVGRFVIVYNGEIYNHKSLADELLRAGASFRGHSDTEVLLAGFEHWGLQATLTRSVGMFAVAVWDRKDKTLTLARDRLGEKPLFYGWRNGTLIFGSELKALRAYPGWQGEVDPDALGTYLRLGYVPSPRSIYRGVYKLVPGSILVVSFADREAESQFSPIPGTAGSHVLCPKRFWSVDDFAGTLERDGARPERDDVVELESLLRGVVREQMVADVPLGAFLSGGIDSSTVVALMQAESHRPIRTFTIGFEESGFDEAGHAREVASHLGTDHTDLYITSHEGLATVPKLASVYDEPMADSAQIPTLLVAQLARQHVTVALSGDGGDEVFGGYNRYRLAQQMARLTAYIPSPLRRGVGSLLLSVEAVHWDRLLRMLQPVSSSPFLRQPRLGNRIHKLADALRQNALPEIYQQQVSFWPNPEKAMTRQTANRAPWADEHVGPASDPLRLMLRWDQQNYLPDDHLVRVDRASMSTALEVRAPLLDPRIVEFSWRLPSALKVRDGVGKWILRQVLYRHVPRALVERPKMGFSVPIERWLRTGLRDWAEDLLDRNNLSQDEWLCPDTIRRLWERHLAEESNSHHELWTVLMYLAWKRSA